MVARGVALRSFSAQGETVELPVRLEQWSVRTRLELGVARGLSLFASVPVVYSHAYVEQIGVGSAELGARLGTHGDAPSRSVAVELSVRSPLGFSGGSLEGGALPLCVGTTDLRSSVIGRLGISGFRFEGEVEGWARLGGEVAWAGTYIKPGDMFRARAEVLLQAGPLAFGPSIQTSLRARVRRGSSRSAIAETGGVSAAIKLRALLQLTRGAEIEVGYVDQLHGTGNRFAYLPDLQPLAMETLQLGGNFRW